MLRHETNKTITLNPFYDVLFPERNALFFDIETTGLSPANSRIYLIGALSYEKSIPVFHQWFSEDLSDEKCMLHEFLDLCSNYDTLITYNGETFDIPFIKSCTSAFHMDYSSASLEHFCEMESFDIYKKLRPVRKMIKSERLNQKSMERYIGINRHDPFDGGQLIEVYDEFLGTHDEKLYQTLLLHNREDVLNLPEVMRLLSYKKNIESSVDEMQAYIDGTSLIFTGKVSYELPASFSCSFDDYTLFMEGNTITIFVRTENNLAKLYYPDYKEYYYFPIEDTAIHKSVAQFTDKAVRKQATPKTSYTKVKNELLLSDPAHILNTGIFSFLIKNS